MKFVTQLVLLPLIFQMTACGKESEASKQSEGKWIELSKNPELPEWTNPYDHGTIKYVDGVIELTGDKKFFLTTKETYSDFVIEAEIKLPEGKANSGIIFRGHVEPGNVYGYQAECDGSDRCWSGGFYDESRRKWIWPSKEGQNAEASQAFFKQDHIAKALKRNDWNKYRITCIGQQIKIEINGVLITQLLDAMDSEGHIGIQHHGEKGQTYRFRNIRIQPLTSEPKD